MYKIKFNIIAIIIIFLAQATTFAQVDSTANAQALADSIAVEKSTSDTTTEVVGKLNLVTFDDKQVQLCLVPVNGARLPNATQLQAELNSIFAPAVASVTVTTHSGLTMAYANGQNFVHGGSGWLSVYNADQKAAIQALTDAQDDVYYLFFVDNAVKLDPDGNRTIVAGYMPICRRYGFIYDSPTSKYVAHELAHGAFALHHTFSDESESYHAPQGTTPNLMDYSGGTALNHLQWQWMHESHTNLLGFLDDESEGESINNELVKGHWVAVNPPRLIDNRKALKYDKQFMPDDNYIASTHSIYMLENGDMVIMSPVDAIGSTDVEYKIKHQGSEEWVSLNINDFEYYCLKCELDEVGERILKDVILSDETKAIAKIGVGIIALAAAVPSGGTSLSVLGAVGVSFGVTSATMTTVLGTTELVLALKDEDELIEKLPNGYLDATVGLTVEYFVDNPKYTQTIRFWCDFTESAIAPTDALRKIKLGYELKDMEKINTLISTGNIINISIDE